MRLIVLVLLAAFGALSASAQYVSLHGGISQWFFAEQDSRVLDVEAGLPLAHLGANGTITVEGGLRLGTASRDGSARSEPCASCTYDRRNVYGGAVVGARLNRAWLPLRLGFGLTAHSESIRAQEPTLSTRDVFVTADLHVRLGVPLPASLTLEAGAVGSAPLGGRRSSGSRALTLGLRWQR